MIESQAGTISQITIQVYFTPEQCMLYESCVRNVLCKVTECIINNKEILVSWIW